MASTDLIERTIDGTCDPAFDAVRAAFEENFARHDELGSAVTVFHEGEKVVDLWGGYMDAARTRPWHADTMCLIYSISKSLCALSVHILADRGQVDLDAPVATYWPDFGGYGKQDVSIRHILSHRCGVCFADAAEPGDIYDFDKMVRNLEVQTPAWPPGTTGAYNTVNIGYLAGEVVRRVSGQPIRKFLHDNVCAPLDADLKLGVDDADLDRVADLMPNKSGFSMGGGLPADHPLLRAWQPMPKPFDVAAQNTAKFRTAGIPSFGGFATARGLARIYAALANGGQLDGVRLLSRDALERATTAEWESPTDAMTGQPMRMALGFWKTYGDFHPFGPNPEAFGHSGSGGARVLADPERNLALAFVSNYQSERLGGGVRTEAIVDAAFANL